MSSSNPAPNGDDRHNEENGSSTSAQVLADYNLSQPITSTQGLRSGLTSYGDAHFSLFLRKVFIKALGYSDDARKSRPQSNQYKATRARDERSPTVLLLTSGRFDSDASFILTLLTFHFGQYPAPSSASPIPSPPSTPATPTCPN